MMNCIIVDDEPIARRGMERIVSRHPQLNLLGTLDSAEAAAAFMTDNQVDLVFLDIQMPGTDGLESARRIPEKTLVIFTTAYPEYAVDSYSVDAVGYLVKPIDTVLFDKAVAKALDYKALMAKATAEQADARSDRDYMIVKADRRFHRIPYREILFIEGLKDYVIFRLTEGRRLVTRTTVKSLEEILPGEMFARVNKSNIVNLDAVESFDSNDVVIGDTEIAIGAGYRDAVIERLLG